MVERSQHNGQNGGHEMSPAKRNPQIEDADPDSPFENLGVRQNQDGDFSEEAPRTDFINALVSERGEDGVPRRAERPSSEIHRDLLAKDYLKEPITVRSRGSSNVVDGILTGSALRAQELANQPRPKAKPKRAPQRTKTADAEEIFHSLRLEAGLTPREVVRLMSNPNFNRPTLVRDLTALSFPAFAGRYKKIRLGKSRMTMGDLLNKLPMVEKTPILASDIALYRDYASGNYTEDELAERHDPRRLCVLRLTENEIIIRLNSLGLIKEWAKRSRGVQIDDFERARAEGDLIQTAGADKGVTVIGAKYKFGVGKCWQQFGLT